MFKYIFSFLLLCSHWSWSQNADSLKVLPKVNQIKIGIDISKPILHSFAKNIYGYEGYIDYYFKNEIYPVIELGYGGSKVDYSDLKYESTNSFVKVGFDKNMLQRMSDHDWDYLFFGLRYATAFIQRSEGNYVTTDEIWGTTSGIIPSKSFTGHWIELNAGVRVELMPRIFAGYNLRTKFLLNQQSFKELPPAYVAGYGKGEKSTVFDMNFYLIYALRWSK